MEEDYFELDIVKLWGKFKKLWGACLFLCVLGGISGYCITTFLITPTYKATGKIIVVQNGESINPQLSYNDVQLSQKLVTTYSEILRSERISDIVLSKLNLDYSSKQYNDMVSVSAANNTEVINVAVVSKSPQEAMDMSNTIIDVFQEEIFEIMNIENISVLNPAKIPNGQNSPNIILNTLYGVIVGIILSIVTVLISSLKDSNIKEEEEFRELLGFPVIGVIPDFFDESINGGNSE